MPSSHDLAKEEKDFCKFDVLTVEIILCCFFLEVFGSSLRFPPVRLNVLLKLDLVFLTNSKLIPEKPRNTGAMTKPGGSAHGGVNQGMEPLGGLLFVHI